MLNQGSDELESTGEREKVTDDNGHTAPMSPVYSSFVARACRMTNLQQQVLQRSQWKAGYILPQGRRLEFETLNNFTQGDLRIEGDL